MAYGCGTEFPNVHGGYPDLCELLYLYKKLTEEYAELLKTIQDTQKELNDYMANVNSLIPGWISTEMEKYVDELNQLKTEVALELKNNQNAISAFLAEYNEKVTIQLSNNLSAVTNRINQNEQWVLSQLKASEDHTEELIRRFTETYKQAFKNQNQYVAQQLADWTAKNQEQFDQVTKDNNLLFATLAALTAELHTLENRVDESIAQIQSMIENYKSVMRLWYYQHRYEDKKWLEEQIAEMQKQMENLPESKLPIFNYFRNRQTGINQWVDDMWNYAMPIGGFSALEWQRATWLTAEEFNTSNITCIEFYADGKNALDADRWKYYTFSPISGEFVWIGRALQEVANALNPDAVKAENYDAYNVKADTYDGKNITANEYRKGRY